MKLVSESNSIEEYLKESDVVDYSNSIIQDKLKELFTNEQTEIEKVKKAFEFVRDNISHSWDIQGTKITCKAL